MTTTSPRSQHAGCRNAEAVAPSTHRAAARAFKPITDGGSDWRLHFRQAIAQTGHTHESIAAVWGVARQIVGRLFNRSSERVLNAAQLEALRDDGATRDVWLAFLQRHCAPGGAVVTVIDPDGADHGERLASLTVELSDVLREYASAMADGTVCNADRERVLCELRQAADRIAAAIAGLESRAA